MPRKIDRHPKTRFGFYGHSLAFHISPISLSPKGRRKLVALYVNRRRITPPDKSD